MFGKSKGRNRSSVNKYGGAAGNSSSNNAPGPGTSNYDLGYTGDRASRQAGGEKMGQQQRGVPLHANSGSAGDGGCAWDSSMSPFMRVPVRGAIK